MNTVPLVGVLLLFALAVVGSAWYIAFCLRTAFSLRRRWLLRILVMAALVGSFMLMVPATNSAAVVAGLLYVLGGYLFAGYVFLTLAFVLLHAIERVWPIPKARVGAAALLIAAGTTLVGGIGANTFSVVETDITLPGVDRDVVAMQLLDIHVGHHRGRTYLEKIVDETNQRKPDIVLITGDLIDSESAFLPGELEPLTRFSASVYYVGGNHEKYVDAERAFALVKKYGVNVLRNQVTETHGLQLVGLDYMNADEDRFDLHPSDDPRTIKSVLASLHLKDGVPSGLLQHSPAGAQYAAANGIDLIMRATHGGQFFPGTLVAKTARRSLVFPRPLRSFDVRGSVAHGRRRASSHGAADRDVAPRRRARSLRQSRLRIAASTKRRECYDLGCRHCPRGADTGPEQRPLERRAAVGRAARSRPSRVGTVSACQPRAPRRAAGRDGSGVCGEPRRPGLARYASFRIFGGDVQVHPGAAFDVPLDVAYEYAALVLNGDCSLEGQPLQERVLYYLGANRSAVCFTSRSGGRLLLVGGPPFPEKILMWWNFVARTPQEIADARTDWEERRRFGEVTGYSGPRLAAPSLVKFANPNPAS